MTTAQSIFGALGWIALTFGEAWLGSRFLPDEWHKNLNKPGWKSPELDFCSRLGCSYGCRSVAGMETIRVDGRFLSIRAIRDNCC
jgi:hypothetical protein